MTSKSDFIVVGSGPAAWAVVSEIPTQYSIVLIDNGNELEQSSIRLRNEAEIFCAGKLTSQQEDEFLKHVLKNSSNLGKAKSYFGSHFMYGDRFSKDESNPRASSALGGYSTIWGATLDETEYSNEISELFSLEEFIEMNSNLWDELAKEGIEFKTKSLSMSKNIEMKLEKDFELTVQSELSKAKSNLIRTEMPTNLAILKSSEKGKCTECGLCQIGCPRNLIWNSGFAILNRRKDIKYIRASALKFKETSTSVELDFLTHSGLHSIFGANLILCAGVLGSSKILMNSLSNLKRIEFLDGKTFFTQSFSFRKSQLPSKRVTLSERSFKIKTKKYRLVGQIYTRSTYSDVRAKLAYPFLNKVPVQLQNFILDRVQTFLIYHDTPPNTRFILERHGKKLALSSSFDQNSRKSSSTSIGLKIKFKLYLLLSLRFEIPGRKFPLLPGGGNHIGASKLFFDSESSVSLFKSQGRIPNLNRVLVLDGSCLPEINPGPITFTIMALCKKNFEKFRLGSNL